MQLNKVVGNLGKERQLRKQEEVRNSILDAARGIIAREGMQALSIRKITGEIDYSPAIVYHYFKDKNEIIETLVAEGYQKILKSIGSVQRNEQEPEKEIIEAFTKYMQAALEYPEFYMAVVLNEVPAVAKKTAVLEQGISRRSPTMQFLCGAIQRGIELGRFAPGDPELTAQVVWTATFGLVVKLIVEKDIPEEQVKRLMERHFALLLHGIMREKPEENRL